MNKIISAFSTFFIDFRYDSKKFSNLSKLPNSINPDTKPDTKSDTKPNTNYFLNYVIQSINNHVKYYIITHDVLTSIVDQHSFSVDKMELFLFDTGVGIMTLRVDPGTEAGAEMIANISYRLKNRNENNYLFKVAEATLAHADIGYEKDSILFHSGNKAKGTAYFFNYVAFDGNEEEEHNKILYKLTYGYDSRFTYGEHLEMPDKESIIHPTDGTYWGVSLEGASCVAYNRHSKSDFLDRVFKENLSKQYTTMMALIQHQKYAIYDFLEKYNKIEGKKDNYKEMQEYRTRIIEFKSRYGLDVISETTNYQSVYRLMRTAMHIGEMYSDLEEKSFLLAKQLEKHEERREKESDNKINKALTVLSLLALFSALTDGISFIGSIENWTNFWPKCTTIASIILSAVIFTVWLVMVIMIFKKKNREDEDD